MRGAREASMQGRGDTQDSILIRMRSKMKVKMKMWAGARVCISSERFHGGCRDMELSKIADIPAADYWDGKE